MLNARWMIPKWRNPDVTSRYHSPLIARNGSYSPSFACASVSRPARLSGSRTVTYRKTATLTAISDIVTSAG